MAAVTEDHAFGTQIWQGDSSWFRFIVHQFKLPYHRIPSILPHWLTSKRNHHSKKLHKILKLGIVPKCSGA
jgi:hypothetical protein